MIAFTDDTLKIVPQSLDNGIFERFIFTDGSRSSRLTAAHGEALEGAKGTAPAGGNIAEEESGWEADYMARHGLVDQTGFVREAYDAAVALMLAAELAISTDGGAIRDALPLNRGRPRQALRRRRATAWRPRWRRSAAAAPRSTWTGRRRISIGTRTGTSRRA